MKLSQTRAIPLAILIAILAAAIAMFIFSGKFVLGHEDPAECDVSTVGLSIITFDENDEVIYIAGHGDQVSYRIILSIPELDSGDIACNYGGGQLTIALPDGETVNVSGFDGTPDIGLIQPGSIYKAPAVDYTVSQHDANNMVLLAQVNYAGGSSHKVPVGQKHPTVSSVVLGQVRLAEPSVAIAITPAQQVVYEGGSAGFTVTVTNTGSLELSNLAVADSMETDCGRTIPSLAAGASTEYSCQMSSAQSGVNDVTVTAAVLGGVSPELASVQDTASASVSIEGIEISIEMTPALQLVRAGNQSTFEITVQNPNTTGLVDVAVSAPEAAECDRAIGAMEAGGTVVYTCNSVPASGDTTVTAGVTGAVANVGGLADSASADVSVFELDLAITKSPDDQTIREGAAAAFTITVSNQGSTDLSDVVVSDGFAPDCSRALGTIASKGEVVIECVSGALADDIATLVTVTGTAPDGGPVESSDTANVVVLRPNTVVAITELDTMVLRLVVQVLTITETNTGDSPLTDVYVDVEPANVRLTADSKEYIGGDASADGVLDPGETWEWRLVMVSVAGDHVVAAADADALEITATGHGTDELGGDVTFPAFATEQQTMAIPIMNK